MAETGETTQQQGNGSDTRKTALRAAAIAAASGATAIAAKKAFSGSGSGTASKVQNGAASAGGGASALGGMVESGWNAARDSLVPFAEEAANAAGEYLGNNGPDFVRESIVPAFIEGFQNAQKKSAGGE